MNNLLNIFKIIIILSGGVIFLRCSHQITGAGSETTNGIVGRIINTDGSPAIGTVVKLFPSDYDPVSASGDTLQIDTTDNEGRFNFTKIKEGVYSILARDYKDIKCAIIRCVIIKESDSVLTLPKKMLSDGEVISVDFRESKVSISDYLYIPGTDIFSFLDSPFVVLKDIPAGDFDTILHKRANEKHNILRQKITVNSESKIVISFPNWRYERYIILNTTNNGAGIVENLYGFPVLIRLDGSNFDFNTALQDGSDLRFSKTNGEPLPFEIERWNGIEKEAEIWVRVDTVYGNDSAQSIVMYWGNTNAVLPTNKGLVFDTANGFKGVWHLGDTIKDTIFDASYNNFTGISSPTSSPSISDGVIGNCRYFDGSSFITIPNSADGALNFAQNDSFTISAWVYVESFDGMSHVIVSKNNLQYFMWVTPIHLNTTLWEFANYRDVSGWDLAGGPAVAGEWVFLTGVREGANHKLYINGEVATEFVDFTFTEKRRTDGDLLIGRFNERMASPDNLNGDYCFFKGKIDELRISGNVRSAAWIKLCYMNQRKDNNFVKFK